MYMVFRDPRFAAKNYQMRGTHLDHTPRHKFMFWVRFVRTTDASSSDPNSRWPNGISFKVHSVDRPRFSIKTQTINSYNKKRVVQTGIEYQPISMKFYDTYDDTTLNFIREYTQFYYGDFNNASSSAWRHDQTSGEMEMGSGAWGFYNGKNDTADSSYFFDRVEIYTFGNGRYTRWDLVHPKISDITPDPNDYSDGNTPQELTITLAYEGVIWPEIGTDFEESTTEMMALDEGEYGDDFNSSSKLVFATENFGNSQVALGDTPSSGLSLDSLFQPPTASGSTPSLGGLNLNSIASIGAALGLNFGTPNIAATPMSGQSNASAIQSILGGNNNIMSQATSMVSSLLGRSNSLNLGSLTGLFSGFFSDDDLTLTERKRLAQPVNQTQYTNYVSLLDAAVKFVLAVRNNVDVASLPINVRESMDSISSLADSAGLIFVGETGITQVVSKLETLMRSLGAINKYLSNSVKGSSSGASHAAYEVARARLQRLGIYDRSIATIVADDIMLENKQAGYNRTDFSSWAINPDVFSKINAKLGSEAQLGVMNPVLSKPGLNPTQRALRHQLDRSPSYLKQMELYMNNSIVPNGGSDESN